MASSSRWVHWERSMTWGGIGGAVRWCSRCCRAARALRVAEVDLHAGVDRELDVFGHLFALVPGDRTAQLGGQRHDPFGHRGADRGARDRWGASTRSHNGCDARPTSRSRSSSCRRSDRLPSDRAPRGRRPRPAVRRSSPCRGAALADTAFGVGLGSAHRPTGPQTGVQLLAERAAALHEQRLIDRLVRHAHLRVVGILLSQPPRDLLGRPSRLELAFDDAAEPSALGELRSFRSQRPPRARDQPATPDTSSGRRWCSPPGRSSKLTGPSRERSTGATNPRPDPRDLLSLFERQPKLRPLPRSRTSPAASAMNLRNDEFCRPRCLAMRLTGTPASRISQIVFLSSSESRATQHLPIDDTKCSPIRTRVAMTS